MYFPLRSVSFQVALLRFATLVFFETPGPFRWKLSFAVASVTLIVNFPALTDLTRLLPFLSEIELRGPTVAFSFVGFGGGGGGFPAVKVFRIWSGWKSHR